MKQSAVYAMMMIAVLAGGCGKPSEDERVNIASGVGSDTLLNNIILRPVLKAFSALIGEGIEVKKADLRTNDEGFLELQVSGYNRSYNIRRFDYNVEWVDKDGLVIPTKTGVWQKMSVQPKSNFAILSVAPRKDAADFRMNTRKSN